MTAHWNANLGLRLRRFDQWSIPVGVYSRYQLIGCFINIISRFRIVRDCASEMAFDWFVNDVAGIVCSAITYLLVLYSQFVIVSVVLLPDPIVSETIQVRLCSFWSQLLNSTNYLQVHSFKFLRNLVLVEWEGFHIFTKFACICIYMEELGSNYDHNYYILDLVIGIQFMIQQQVELCIRYIMKFFVNPSLISVKVIKSWPHIRP